MRAILCTAFDGPDALQFAEAPDPVPGPGQVVVKVHAASVSYMDMLMTQGKYQLKPDLPYIPGSDAAGVVEAVGEGVTAVAPGDRVSCTNWHGAFAEKMLTEAHRCHRLPEGVPFDVASMIMHNYLTAYHALIHRARIKPGEFLFVSGAAGGVGMAAIDMGRKLGARVIAGVGDAAKFETVTAAGAEFAVDYRGEDLRARLKEITEGHGVDVVFDNVGGPMFEQLARATAWDGRILPIGFASGEIPSLPMNLCLLKGFSVVGVFCGSWSDRFPEDASAASAQIMDWVASGELKPVIGGRMPLADAAKAMRMVAERKTQGRLVLEVA